MRHRRDYWVGNVHQEPRTFTFNGENGITKEVKADDATVEDALAFLAQFPVMGHVPTKEELETYEEVLRDSGKYSGGNMFLRRHSLGTDYIPADEDYKYYGVNGRFKDLLNYYNELPASVASNVEVFKSAMSRVIFDPLSYNDRLDLISKFLYSHDSLRQIIDNLDDIFSVMPKTTLQNYDGPIGSERHHFFDITPGTLYEDQTLTFELSQKYYDGNISEALRTHRQKVKTVKDALYFLNNIGEEYVAEQYHFSDEIDRNASVFKTAMEHSQTVKGATKSIVQSFINALGYDKSRPAPSRNAILKAAAVCPKADYTYFLGKISQEKDWIVKPIFAKLAERCDNLPELVSMIPVEILLQRESRQHLFSALPKDNIYYYALSRDTRLARSFIESIRSYSNGNPDEILKLPIEQAYSYLLNKECGLDNIEKGEFVDFRKQNARYILASRNAPVNRLFKGDVNPFLSDKEINTRLNELRDFCSALASKTTYYDTYRFERDNCSRLREILKHVRTRQNENCVGFAGIVGEKLSSLGIPNRCLVMRFPNGPEGLFSMHCVVLYPAFGTTFFIDFITAIEGADYLGMPKGLNICEPLTNLERFTKYEPTFDYGENFSTSTNQVSFHDQFRSIYLQNARA